MPKFFVQSAGRMMPLDDAVWIRYAPCGCPSASVTAMMPDGMTPILTEDQAFRQMLHKKSGHPGEKVKRMIKQGYKVELVTDKRFQELMVKALYEGCPHKPTWGLKPERKA